MKASFVKWLRNCAYYLGEKWGNLFKLIFDPWVILLIILCIRLSLINIEQNKPDILLIITLGISLSSGLLGGILAKRWDDFTERKEVEIRGDSAIRNLKLLLSRSTGLENRVLEYYSRFITDKNKSNISNEVLKTYFEEIIYECVDLDETIINSIEDWKDLMLGETLIETINDIKSAKEQILSYQNEFSMIQEEIKTSQSLEEKSNLKKREEVITQELTNHYRDFSVQTSSAGLYNFSGSPSSGGTITQNIGFNEQLPFSSFKATPFQFSPSSMIINKTEENTTKEKGIKLSKKKKRH